jgi:SAM-dependent methyltransferase
MDPETYHYMGFEIPVGLMRLTGGGPDTFGVISEQHIQHIRKYVGLDPSGSIVEIGCGIGRDAIPLTEILSDCGQYLGIDIIKRSIDWCTGNIAERHGNFQFVHYDVADPLHNPEGTLRISDCKIPRANRSIDLVILQSVFTHTFEEGIIFYLREFARVLKPTGKVYATCFVVDDMLLQSIRDRPVTIFDLSFRHARGDRCFINDPIHPTGAVAFAASRLAEMVSESGLKFVRPMIRGGWSECFPDADCGQDVMILEREIRAPVG